MKTLRVKVFAFFARWDLSTFESCGGLEYHQLHASMHALFALLASILTTSQHNSSTESVTVLLVFMQAHTVRPIPNRFPFLLR